MKVVALFVFIKNKFLLYQESISRSRQIKRMPLPSERMEFDLEMIGQLPSRHSYLFGLEFSLTNFPFISLNPIFETHTYSIGLLVHESH
jgi:hypothetical protein